MSRRKEEEKKKEEIKWYTMRFQSVRETSRSVKRREKKREWRKGRERKRTITTSRIKETKSNEEKE